jgi:hypothetical protein
MASSAEKLRMQVYNAIKGSKDLKEGNYISVAVKNTGFLFFGKKQIVLTGRAASERDKELIEKTAEESAPGLEVVSQVRIGRTG